MRQRAPRLSLPFVLLFVLLVAALGLPRAAHALPDPTGDMEPVTDPVPGNTFGTPIGPPQGGRGDIVDVSVELVPGGIRVCVRRLSDVVTTSSAILWIFGAPGNPSVVAFWENHEGTVTMGASRGGMTIPATFAVDPAGAFGCVTIPLEHLSDSQTVYAHSFSRQTPLGQEPPPEGDPRLRDISDYQDLPEPTAPVDDGATGDSDPPDDGATQPGSGNDSSGGSDSGADDPDSGGQSSGDPGSDSTDTGGSDSGSADADAPDAGDTGDAETGGDGAPSSDQASSSDDASDDDPAPDVAGTDDSTADEEDSGEDDAPDAPAAGIADDSAVDGDVANGGDDQVFDADEDDSWFWFVAFVFFLFVIGFLLAGGGVFLYMRLRPSEVIAAVGDANQDGTVDARDLRAFREAVAGSSAPEPAPQPAEPSAHPLGAQMQVVAPDVMLVRADGKRWSGADIPMHFARDLRTEAATATDRANATERLYRALQMENERLAGGGSPPASDDPELERDRQILSDPSNLPQRLGDIRLAIDEIFTEWYD